MVGGGAVHQPSGDGLPAPDELRRQAQASVREWVNSAQTPTESGRPWIPLAAAAALAAAVCAPVVWPLLAAGSGVAVAGAALSQVGGVGGGLLAEVVIRVWDRLRSTDRAHTGQSALRDSLAAELRADLTQGTPAAAALRGEIAAVLRGVDAVQVALTATIQESAAVIRTEMVRGLSELGGEFTEFRWVLDDVSQQLTVIAGQVAESAAVSREVLDKQQQTLVELSLLRGETRRVAASRLVLDAPAPSTDGAAADRSAEAESPSAAPDAGAAGDGAQCPYLGLATYQPHDAERFFGREELTAQLVARSAELLLRPGLLVVLGPSGSGKSSLVRAGLLPAIAAGALPVDGSWTWPRDLITPGRRPLLELATRIASRARILAGALEADLRADPGRVTGAIRQALLTTARDQASGCLASAEQPAEPRLVLIVDQFEELFTQCQDDDERRTFIAALCAAAGIAGGDTVTSPDVGGGIIRDQAAAREAPALVVLAVRADFYARTAAYPELVPQLQDNQVLVGPISETGLREVIEKPAQRAGLTVDAALVEVLLADLGAHAHAYQAEAGPADQPRASAAGTGWDSYAAGRLALLSYALQQTWRNREGRRLTVAGYRATGGIDSAVALAADTVYDSLDADGRQVLQRVMLRLVALGEGTPDTRRRVSLSELIGADDSAAAALTRAVLAALIEARLVTADADTLEITHETLLTAWPRLRQWLSEDRAGLRIHRDLTGAAQHWTHEGHDTSRLFRGTLLAVTLAWAAGHDEDLNADERAFLAASRRDQLHATRRRQASIALLAAVTLIAAVTAVIAVRNAGNANRQHAIALSRQLAAESLSIDPASPVVARQLAAAAWRISPTGQASSSITALLTEQQQDSILPADPAGVNAVAFSPDGKLLASADVGGYVRLWNAGTGQPVGVPLPADPGTQNGVAAVAFSPDGKLLASADADGYVRLWNAGTGQPVGAALHASDGGRVNAVAFSPDGKLLASAGADGYIRLWKLATGRLYGTPIHGQGLLSEVAFSPRGVLLTDFDGTVRQWNPLNDRPAGPSVSAGTNNGMALSPDGRLLAIAETGGNTVRLWNPATGHSVGVPLVVSSNALDVVSDLAFSPDGKLLATANADGTVRLWNPASGQPAGAELPADLGNRGGVDAIAFSSDGKLLASSDANGEVRLWDAATGQPMGTPLRADTKDQGGVDAVAFSPNGKLLASADGNGSVRLWNVVTGHPVGPLWHADPGKLGIVYGVAFSPDGRLLASANGDGYVRLWDMATGRPFGQPMRAGGRGGVQVSGVTFSPDGKLLASSDLNGTVQLWDPASGQPIGAPFPADTNRTGGVNGVAFSPNGKLLASADVNGYVRLWDVATGRPVGSPVHAGPAGQNGVTGVAFSPDGKLLASANGDGYVRLWNLAAHRSAGSPIPVDPGPLGGANGVAFAPGGMQLASGGNDGEVLRWDIWLFESPYPALCAVVGPPSAGNWARYVRGEPQPSVCG
jgi:WD40 repeat protein